MPRPAFRTLTAAPLALARRGGLLRWLLILGAIDLVFMALHVASALAETKASPGALSSLLTAGRLRIDTDRGASEFYEYLKTGLVVVSLLVLRRRRGRKVYATLAAVFAFLLVDNALRVHERIDEFVPFADHQVELVFLAVLGVVVLGGIVLTWPSGDVLDEGVALICVVLIGILGFFGVILDFAFDLVADWLGIAQAAGRLLENGGELVTLSVILAFVWSFTKGSSHPAGQPGVVGEACVE